MSPNTALRTAWAEDLDPEQPLPEYPRPQLRRKRWQNLNGRWEFAIRDGDAPQPTSFETRIVVPFAVESALGGVARAVQPEERVWYRREFRAPELAEDEQLLLHFGAVDWEAEVWLNGRRLGSHCGGYDPFHFDLSDALAPGEVQELVVGVRDPTNRGPQPIGKQTLEPGGICYTAVTGIWQTVWLEPVPRTRVESLRAETLLAQAEVSIHARISGSLPGDQLRLRVCVAGKTIAEQTAAVTGEHLRLELAIPSLRPWSPDDPFLYDLEAEILRDRVPVDRVESYFGAREISTGRDRAGIWRLFLNGEPLFQLGLLDQGWWPDGLYTAPTDAALAFDIEATRRMGFNLIRKHVKVEPARWYWHADRLGVLVWQDMPSIAFELKRFVEQLQQGRQPEEMEFSLQVTPESEAIYRHELDAMLDALAPFPSIVAWVPFNEAWGQFDTDAILSHVAARDPERLVDGPSGWKDTGTGAIRDCHMYRREEQLPPLESDRPLVYGEFGGFKLGVDGHLAVADGWGYGSAKSSESFEAKYTELLGCIEALVARGLSGAIYTQTTDVESELNGLLTYDRAVFKIDPGRLAALHRRIIEKLGTRA